MRRAAAAALPWRQPCGAAAAAAAGAAPLPLAANLLPNDEREPFKSEEGASRPPLAGEETTERKQTRGGVQREDLLG